MASATGVLAPEYRRSLRAACDRIESRIDDARLADPAFDDRLRAWAGSLCRAGSPGAEATGLAAARLTTQLVVGRSALPGPADAPPDGARVPVPAGIGTWSAALDPIDVGVAGGPPSPAAVFEAVSPEAERRGLGRYTTPPGVADALVGWALPEAGGSAPPRVLDPAAGGGEVLRAALRRLRELEPGRPPARLADRLVGVDVDAFSLWLADRAVAADAGVAPGSIRTHHASFFDLEPGEGDGHLPELDAVVGNPPYIRAEALGDGREGFRRHLEAFDPPPEIGRRSDASVYFVTHATRFLRDGGRLALVLPSKWLTSDYGTDLQYFLFEHYAVHGLVTFDGTAFPEALIEPVLLLAERSRSGPIGPDHDLWFVHLDSPPSAGTLRRVLAGDDDPESGGVRRRVLRSQRDLEPGKLDRFLRTPPAVLEMLDHPGIAPLGSLARVSRGVMTGANAFFFLDRETATERGVEDRFLLPALKSVRRHSGRVLEAADVDRLVVDVHGYVESVAGSGAEPTGAAVRAALEADGHAGLAAYIDRAEAAGHHTGATCRSRSVWFDLGPLEAPDVLVPKLLRERVFTVYNRAGAVPGNAIDGLHVRTDVDPVVLTGVLNSAVAHASIEVHARNEAGMLQLMTYETASLPVPDVRSFSRAATDRVRAATEAVIEDGPTEARQARLDAAVLGAAGVDLPLEKLRSLTDGMRRERLGGT